MENDNYSLLTSRKVCFKNLNKTEVDENKQKKKKNKKKKYKKMKLMVMNQRERKRKRRETSFNSELCSTGGRYLQKKEIFPMMTAVAGYETEGKRLSWKFLNIEK